jgi:thioredoxin-like negative regulator of GroEL
MSDLRDKPALAALPALNQFDFHERLAGLAGPSLIMFSSPDCGGCRHLRRVLQEVHRLEPHWHVFEVDAQRDQALTYEFEVFHLPTVFLFNDGDFHCELQAEARPAAIVEAALEALGRPAEEAP